MQSFARFSVLAVFFAVVVSWGTGCANSKALDVSRSSRQTHRVEPSSGRVRLASNQVAQIPQTADQSTSQPSDQTQPENEKSPNSAGPVGARADALDVTSNGEKQVDPPEGADGSTPKKQDEKDSAAQASRPYTVPSASVRGLTPTSKIRKASTRKTDVIQGAEAAQSRVIGSGSVTGATGLAASQPTARGFVQSERGLTGLNQATLPSAGPTTIFTPVANPSSGPNGACAQVNRAGFGGGKGICRAHTKR